MNQLIKNSNLGYERNKIALPSIGVGGYCLPKDPILFSKLFNNNDGYSLGKNSRQINERNISESFKRISNNNKKFKKTLILGGYFKGLPETIDLRNSPAIQISKLLEKKSKKKLNFTISCKKI